jgi:hypothetical protein
MNFRDNERSRMIGLRDDIFKDPGSGPFRKKPREFVLSDPVLNLWEGIRQDAIEYFKNNRSSGGPVKARTRRDICFRHKLPV